MTVLAFAIRLLASIALGVFFYGGLSWTVRRLSTTPHPVLLTLASLWIRLIVVLAGFVVLMAGRWEYAVAILLGFTLGRFLTPALFNGLAKGRVCT